MVKGSLLSHLTSPFSSVVNHWNRFKNWQQAKEEALIGEFNLLVVVVHLRSYNTKAFCLGSEMESRPVGALSGQCLTGKRFLLQNYQDCL